MATKPGRARAIHRIGTIAVVLALSAGCQSDSPAPRPDATPSGSPVADPARAGLSAPPRTTAADARRRLAVRSFQAYLRQQAAALPARARPFTDAVRAGDVTAAKKSFAAGRTSWERIQWVALLLPELDRRIDARADDFAGPAATAWTGWHRLELILWTRNSTAGAAPLADRLDRDLGALHQAVARLRVTPAMMATGITRLVDEAIAEKLPGAEDRYARTDLADLAGNVQGAEAGYTIARPVLAGRDATLARVVDRRFAAVDRTLARYRGAAGYRPYPALSPADRLLLEGQLSALAESLSTLPGLFTR
jgi:iron uptake system component EfeO